MAEHLIPVAITAAYLLLGWGAKELFRKAAHPACKVWCAVLIWPIFLILEALLPDDIE